MDYYSAEQELKKIISNSTIQKIVQNCIDFLYEAFEKYSWVGIYILKESNLILSHWKGKHITEHTTIPIGKGICGYASKTGKTELVTDVLADDRYLACFPTTRSEIVVPIKKNRKIIGEIDIDSNIPNAFTKEDTFFLEKIADMLSKHIQ